MAVAEDDVALLPVDPALEHKFTRAYENPRFVPEKGQAAVPAHVAPGGDIAIVRDDGRLPDDSFQGWILWNKETLPSSIDDYTRRFGLAAV